MPELFPTDLIQYSPVKSVNSRRQRPAWAQNDKLLAWRVLGPSLIRRIRIAYLYWRSNWTARQIAAELSTTVNAVECVLRRIKDSR